MSSQVADTRLRPTARVEIITYAPTEFYHCQHCEIVWSHLDFGHKLHAEQQTSGQLPPDLETEYRAISDWALEAFQQYGERLSVKVVDAVSIEGLFKSILHRARRFPMFIVDGRERISGFDRIQLDRALQRRLGAAHGNAEKEVISS